MKPELKPCPFCGENINLFVQRCEGTIIHPAYRVCCDNCGASTGYVDKDNHVDNWNHRAPAEPVNEHPDDAAVDGFAAAMKAKLAKKRAEGRGGWQACDAAYLSELLRGHVEKGDPVDVANLAMMLHQNRQFIQPAPQPAELSAVEKFSVIQTLLPALYAAGVKVTGSAQDGWKVKVEQPAPSTEHGAE